MPFLILTLSVSLEYFPELFIKFPFKYQEPGTSGFKFDTTYKDAIWFVNHSLLMLVCIIYAFMLVPSKHIAVKYLIIAPISWWTIELYQKVCWLAKINNSRLFINDGSKWQMVIALFIVLGVIYGFTRFKS